jgi:hypothetical protein
MNTKRLVVYTNAARERSEGRQTIGQRTLDADLVMLYHFGPESQKQSCIDSIEQ